MKIELEFWSPEIKHEHEENRKLIETLNTVMDRF